TRGAPPQGATGFLLEAPRDVDPAGLGSAAAPCDHDQRHKGAVAFDVRRDERVARVGRPEPTVAERLGKRVAELAQIEPDRLADLEPLERARIPLVQPE